MKSVQGGAQVSLDGDAESELWTGVHGYAINRRCDGGCKVSCGWESRGELWTRVCRGGMRVQK